MNITPQGFTASAVSSGIVPGKRKLDLCAFFSSRVCSAAGLFTRNRVQAAPVVISKKNIRAGKARAVLINSGNANAGTGARGNRDAQESAGFFAGRFNIPPRQVLLGSTGVIGSFLNMQAMRTGISRLSKQHVGPQSFLSAAQAMMTTDTFPKIAGRKLTINNKKVIVWGCAKGAGMIHPDMATMLSVILTDAVLTPVVARQLLSHAVERSFNRISVDGDTSTNDTVFLLANGAAGNDMLTPGKPGWSAFSRSLCSITEELAHMIVVDGEGAEHCITVYVEKAKNKKDALSVARTIATSPLVKTAVYGADPNWGRILAAAGRSGAAVNPGKIDIYFGPYRVCKNGMVDSFPEQALKKLLRKKEIEIRVILHQGRASEKFLFSDLTDKYIHINAHYTT